MPNESNYRKPFALRLLSVIMIILLGILVLTSLVLFATERWLFKTWAALAMDEILYHLNASLQGTNPEMVQAYILHYGIYILAAFIIFVVSMMVSRRDRALRTVFVCLWVAVSLGLIEFSVYDVDQRINLGDYFHELSAPEKATTGDFIYDNYVESRDVKLEFPEQKRNLIYIFLESMEMTYSDEKNGGAFSKNVIPELTELAKENEDFSGDNDTLNGGISLPGTTWTMGGMFAQSTGMPLKLPISGLQVESQIETDFFPNLTALGDVLQEQGYHQVLMIGSDAAFGGRKAYFDTHGEFEIQDYTYAKDHHLIPSEYYVFWGYEDEKLFANAQEELKTLAKENQPFNLTLLTVDTHFEDGYVCDLCDDAFGKNQYANVMACSSRQVAKFVSWVQKQDFYENTTIVLCGDHPTMDKDFCNNVPKDYQRKTYTAVINSAVQPVAADRERVFSTMDLYPTTLAALGVKIHGNRLGLGTNLFSLSDTLLEKYGVEACAAGLEKPSEFMDGFSKVSITEETMKSTAEDAKLFYRVENNGKVTFIMNNAYELSSSSITAAELELTTASGETIKMDMEVYQPKTDPNVYWCIAETNYKESDLRGMKGEVFLSVKGFEHYSMATWSD